MSELQVRAERRIAAPVARVYHYLADFNEHHPRILPPAFSNFRVEQGGVGAGTVSTFTVALGGMRRAYRTHASEPIPGRVLMETDELSSTVTTFTVTPEGDQSRVRIETNWQSAPGLAGLFERLMAPPLIRRLYLDELDRLDRYARERAA